MTITLRRLSPWEFSTLAPQLVDIYIDAMGYSPSIRGNRVRSWRGEITRPGFTAIIAESEHGVVGLAYGFLGSPDTWWDRQLRRGFAEHGGPTQLQEELLRSYFELAEIHVRPGQQGFGIGRRLLKELLWNVPANFVLLSTPEVPDEDNAAFHLYRQMGFSDVLRGLRYPADTRAFAILGAPLPLPARP